MTAERRPRRMCSPSTWTLHVTGKIRLPEKFVLPRKITTTADKSREKNLFANRFLFRVFILTDFNYIDSPIFLAV
jgi:hypothetical protein